MSTAIILAIVLAFIAFVAIFLYILHWRIVDEHKKDKCTLESNLREKIIQTLGKNLSRYRF